jgi:hypothetical protein
MVFQAFVLLRHECICVIICKLQMLEPELFGEQVLLND